MELVNFENISIGRDVVIHPSAKIQGVNGKGKNLVIGDHTYIGERVQIMVDDFSIGDYSKIHHDTNIHGYNPCSIGHNAWIGQFCIIDSVGGVTIGNNFGLGAHSQVWSHIKYGDTLFGCKWNSAHQVTIGNDVWMVGHVIFCGDTAEDYSMALAGSVVTKPMLENKVYVGTPAEEKPTMSQFDFRINPLFHREMQLKAWASDLGLEKVKVVTDVEQMEYLSDISYFNPKTRTYTKKGTYDEIKFMKFLLPEKAKFVPN